MGSLLPALYAFADLHFLVTADWGGLPCWPWVSPAQLRIASAMGELARRQRPRFVLSLGDHFYFRGVQHADDPRFERTFESAFSDASLQGSGFWKIVSGNHDHEGNVSAQLEYAARAGSRWHYPAMQHTWRETFGPRDARTTVDFVLIDTVLLCGMPDGKPPSDAGKHWQWVEDALLASDADFLVVGGHYPVHSPSRHGPTRCLVNRLKPLLERAQASLYFSGHDHCLFHIEEKSKRRTGPHYHGVGAGFTTSKSQRHLHTVPPHALRFFYDGAVRPFNIVSGGFAVASVSAGALTVAHYSAGGRRLYQSTVRPRTGKCVTSSTYRRWGIKMAEAP
ncbi:hypothetical protein AB1Y20_005132 [Prymnesium parvum]|uniref:acid phosphatase n=1 Tax=Prymnesium parvum TaxID=97485 RepID=A0AB34J3D9_PRYPA